MCTTKISCYKSFSSPNELAFLPKLTISFDGCYEETINNCLDLMEEFNIRGTFFISSAFIGRKLEGRTVADETLLKDLIHKNMEIGSHGTTHIAHGGLLEQVIRAYLSIFSEFPTSYIKEVISYIKSTHSYIPDEIIKNPNLNKILEEILTSKLMIEELLNDYKVRSYSYPGGTAGFFIAQFLQSLGFTSASTTIRGINRLKSINLFRLRRNPILRDTSLKHLENSLRIVEKKGGYIIYVFHVVTTKPFRLYDVHLNIFKEFVELLSDKPLLIAPQREIVEHIKNLLHAQSLKRTLL